MSDITSLIQSLSQTGNQSSLNNKLSNLTIEDLINNDSGLTLESLINEVQSKQPANSIVGMLPPLPRKKPEAPQSVVRLPTNKPKPSVVPYDMPSVKGFDRSKVSIDRPYTVPKDLSYTELKYALGSTESSGNPKAESPVGARGLYQFMPKTAEWIAKKYNIPWKGKDALFDPKYNSKLADAYLDYLTNKYNGDMGLTLAAYNWGEGNISKLQNKIGKSDFASLFKHLPSETKKHYNTTMAKIRHLRGGADAK